MKFNFYISCDTGDEAIQCVRFIERMTKGEKTWEDHRETEKPRVSEARLDKIMHTRDAEAEEMNAGPSAINRKNVSPGEPSISKIGQKTTAHIKKLLLGGLVVPARYAEHMKLLWKRGNLKYDGKEYFV